MRLKTFISLFLVAAICTAQTASPQSQAKQDNSQAIAKEIVESEIPVLVDFWAAWCKPCHMLTPIIKEIEKQYAGKLVVKKINVDIHRKIAAYFRINSIPAIFIVKDKTVVKQIPGVQPKEVYIKAIDEIVAHSSKGPSKNTDTN
ncbi:MAG: thioredoxin [Chitinispirillaceae bacterium]